MRALFTAGWPPLAGALLALSLEAFGVRAVGCLALLVLLWRYSANRWLGGAGVAVFYALAARDIPLAVSGFGGSLLSGSLGYGVAVGLLAGLWTLLWGHRLRALRLTAVLILLIVPPLGLIGWGHPLLSAATLAPFGLIGLALIATLLLLAVTWHTAAVLLGVATVLSVIHATPPPRAESVIVVDTTLPPAHGTDFMALYRHNETLQHYVHEALRQPAAPVTTVLLPESVAGPWTPATQDLWQRTRLWLDHRRYTALVGADTDRPPRSALLVRLPENDAYIQQIPTPLLLWAPWRADSFALRLTAPLPQVSPTRPRYLYLICYEQVVLWPALRQMFYTADIEVIVAVSNYWWMRGRAFAALARLQTLSAQALALLNRAPLALAVNR